MLSSFGFSTPAGSLGSTLHSAIQGGFLERVQSHLSSDNINKISPQTGDTPLMLAIRCGHAAIADVLLRAGADSNARHKSGETPIMLAAQKGNAHLIQMLVACGARVDVADADGIPAMMFAAKHGYLDAVCELINANANVNVAFPARTEHGCSALMVAAKNGHVDTMRALLQAHANRDAVDHRGNTALMCAAQSKNANAVTLLLQSEKDVNATNGSSATALMMAARDGQLEMVRALLDAGARVNMVNGLNHSALTHAQGHEVVAALRTAQAELGSGSMVDITFMPMAVSGNVHAADAPMLPENGAGAASAAGLAALSQATNFGRIATISELIKGMRPEPLTTAALYGAQMRSAIENGKLDTIKAMVTFGGLFINDYLLLAVKDGNAAAVETLLTAGANANFEVASKTNALMLAVHWGHADVVKSLLAAGAAANAVSADGHTALLYAVNSGNIKIVEMLIAAKADTGIKHADHTLLMIAVLRGQAAMVQKLLQATVKPDAMRENLHAVLEYAQKHGQTEMIQALLGSKEKMGLLVHHDADGLFDGSRTVIEMGAAAAAKAPEEEKISANMAATNASPSDAARYGDQPKPEASLQQVSNASSAVYAGWTKLCHAVSSGTKQQVDALLHAGENIHAVTQDGMTPLILAVQLGRVDVVELLASWDEKNQKQGGTLKNVTQAGSIDAMHGARADVNAAVHSWETAIKTAAVHGSTEIFRVLEKYGGDINGCLLWSAHKGKADAVETLRNSGANIDVKNALGETPLMMAIEKGHIDVVKMLLQSQVDINAVDQKGQTALMFAVHLGHTEIVKALLEGKANIHIVSSGNVSALALATMSGKTEIHEMLLKVACDQATGFHGLSASMESLEVHAGMNGSAGMDAAAAMEDISAAAYAVAPQALVELHSLVPRDGQMKSDGMVTPACSPELDRVHDDMGMSASDAARSAADAEHGVQLAAQSPAMAYPFG